MHSGVNNKIAVFALVLSLGCGQKNQKDFNFDSAPSVQNSNVQNLSMVSAQKSDSQNSRPSLAMKEDSLGNKPILSASPADESKAKQNTTIEKRFDNRPKKDLVDNLPDLRPESKNKEATVGPIQRGGQHQDDKQATQSRPSVQRPGSGEHQSVKVQAKDLTEQYEGLKARSRRYYQIALGFLGKQDDSALVYVSRAIQIFENGSLFRVKAEALYNLKYFTNAEIACDICLNRTDHWDFVDIDRALKLKCGCYKKNFERFPSQESKEQYENACKAVGIAAGSK